MIVDIYRPDPEGPDHIYKRWRDADGNLIEETVEDFQPYLWIKASTPTRIVERVLGRYPGSSIDWYDRAKALRTEEELVKVYAYRTRDLREMAKEFGPTWEADLSLVDRYLIDSIDEMPEWTPRVWHFDLEWDPKEDFTTVMAVADSYSKRNVVFCWNEESALSDSQENKSEIIEVDITDEDGIQHQFSYERVMCSGEDSMYQAFFSYLEECNPDVFVAHAIMWADLPHIIRRFPEFRKLSPLGRVMRPPRDKRGYKYEAQPICGRLCFDTAAPLRSGTGFERVWKDSGQPQLKNLKLNTIAETLGYGGKFEMDVFTGWYERFDDFVHYCMQDVLLLKKIDENNHVLNFYLSLQRITGVSFPSCHNVTRFARGLLSRRSEWKAPTKSQQSKSEYEGAFIPPPKPGRYQGVACVDYKGLYPSLILSHNLSWETQVPRHRADDSDVHQLPDGTCW